MVKVTPELAGTAGRKPQVSKLKEDLFQEARL